jgi:hypothetical protein
MRRKDDMENLVTKRSSPGEGNSGSSRKSPTSAQKALITRNLRLAYGEVAGEPVPKQLMDLLNQIDQAEGKKS